MVSKKQKNGINGNVYNSKNNFVPAIGDKDSHYCDNEDGSVADLILLHEISICSVLNNLRLR